MRVILESPYAGDVKKNVEYAKRCMRDCIDRGEYPFASHLLYTQILDDTIPEERELGIKAGLEWGELAEKTVVYIDNGISKGMIKGMESAVEKGRIIEFRSIGL